MLSSITAYADEFGTSSFDFEKQSSHFIVATVITKTSNVENLLEQIDAIRRKHNFQTGELKSQGVGPNHYRRKRILEDVSKLDISVYAVIVNKRDLSSEGFKYKKSFYKFLNNLLYKELFRTYPQLELYVDEHGGNDFMREFKKYVHRQHTQNLFSGSDFNILNSKESLGIQLADFIAGTLGYVFDDTKRSDESEEFANLLSPIILSLNHFPRRLTFDELKSTNIDESFDERIAEVSFLRIQDFLERNVGSDQQKVDQINLLKLLLWFQRANPTNRFITSREIFNHLNQNRADFMRPEYFRTKVVGNLRDKGVLIASGRSGYKIPTSATDLNSFIKHGRRIILPMLNRINQARTTIKMATGNELDLLGGEEYAELKRLLDSK